MNYFPADFIHPDHDPGDPVDHPAQTAQTATLLAQCFTEENHKKYSTEENSCYSDATHCSNSRVPSTDTVMGLDSFSCCFEDKEWPFLSFSRTGGGDTDEDCLELRHLAQKLIIKQQQQQHQVDIQTEKTLQWIQSESKNGNLALVPLSPISPSEISVGPPNWSISSHGPLQPPVPPAAPTSLQSHFQLHHHHHHHHHHLQESSHPVATEYQVESGTVAPQGALAVDLDAVANALFQQLANYSLPTLNDIGQASKPCSTRSKKIPRPRNPFMLYRQYHQEIVWKLLKQSMGDLKHLVDNNILSKIMGKLWYFESELVKEHYRCLADLEKKEHSERYPEYRYLPTKNSRSLSSNSTTSQQ